MHITNMMEEFSRAWVGAVASAAGAAVSRPPIDDDSVDISLSWRSVNSKVRSPRLEAQLKCSARDVCKDQLIKLPLPVKNYNDLVPENLLVPRILIVVLVPVVPDEWVTQSREHMVMKHCGYWKSLRGFPKSDNSANVTVEIPTTQVFTVAELKVIMRRIEEGRAG